MNPRLLRPVPAWALDLVIYAGAVVVGVLVYLCIASAAVVLR